MGRFLTLSTTIAEQGTGVAYVLVGQTSLKFDFFCHSIILLQNEIEYTVITFFELKSQFHDRPKIRNIKP